MKKAILFFVFLFISISQASAFSVSDFTYDAVSISTYGDRTSPVFNDDGTILTVAVSTSTNRLVEQYTLSVAYDINTMTYTRAKSFGSAASVNAFAWNNNGTGFYIFLTNGRLEQYSLSTPYDLSGTSTFIRYITPGSSTQTAMTFSPDGQYLFVNSASFNYPTRYTLSVPWDISTYGSSQVLSVSNNLKQYLFTPDGLLFFILGSNEIKQYNLSSPYTLSGAVQDSIYTFGQTTIGGVFNENISKFWSMGTTTFKRYSTNSVYGLSCTTETIPNYDFINIHPTSTGSVAEYVETPLDYTFAYSTLLSGDNPLQVIFLGIEDVTGLSDFSFSSGSVNFGTQNKTTFSEKKSWLSINSTSISYIKMPGSYGNVNIYVYDDFGNIETEYINIDLSSYSSGYGFPVGESPSVAINFKNTIFSHTIENLEVYAIGENNTIDVEICENVETGEYTIDGEEYIGDPYVDLVGDPTPTEVSFSQNGYLFYDNGFCLKDFIPTPGGGDLIFDIQNPEGVLRTSYPIKSTGLYKYGLNTCSKITTNFHDIPGVYYVKARYFYQGISYDVHTNFYTYTITNPEYITNLDNPWAEDSGSCGTSESQSGFLPGVSQFFACMTETLGKFFAAQYEAVKKIGSLISDMTNIFTTEVRDFSFIPGVYASEPLSSSMTIFDRPEGFSESPFGKLENLLKGAMAVLVVIVSITLIIIVKQND